MDLAKLGIEVDYRETKDVNAELGKISTSTDKIVKKAKLASDALSKIGATGTGGLDKNKTATDKITKSYLDLLVMLENVKKSFGQLGSTQTGTKELQKNLAIVTTELKKSREAGELNATTYKRLATESDKLAVKLNERASALKSLNTGEYEAQRIAAKDLKTKQQQIEIEKLHVQALQENVEINKRWAVAAQNNVALVAKESKERKAESDAIKQGMLLRDKERNIMASDNRKANIIEIANETKARKEQLALMRSEIIAGEKQRATEQKNETASRAALATFKEKQIALQKATAYDLAYHDSQAKLYQMTKLQSQALEENVAVNKRWEVATQNNANLVTKEAAERKAASEAIRQGILLREKENAIIAADNRRSNIIEIANETKKQKELFASLKQAILEREKERAILGADNRRATIVELSNEAAKRKELLTLLKADIIARSKVAQSYASHDAAAQSHNKLLQEQATLLKKDVAASYAHHDKEAQKYHENLKKQQSILGRLSEAYANTTARIKQFAAFIAAAFVVQGIMQGFRGMIDVIVEFDQALKSLQAIAGATTLEAKVMGDSIKKIASDTKFSAGEIAEGMQTIGKAGFTAGEALKMIQGVSNLATGALEDFNTVASLVVTAVRAFGLEVVQTGEITDVFANAITKSKLSVEGLITAFGYVGAAGSQAGLTLSEVSGSLMVLADNGIRASTMGTALRKTLLSMIAPNEALKSALYSVGMSVKDINPGMVGYEQALRNIAPLVWDFERNTVDMAKAQEFFGIRASQVAAILIRETAQGGGISRAIESTRELGAALKMAEKQQEGLGVKFKNLADTVKNVALAVGEAGLTNVLHTLVDRLKAVASWLENIVKSFPIVQMAGYAAAILAISGAVYGLIKALGIAKTAIFAFNAGLLTTPLGLFITGATAAAGIAAYFSNKLEDTSETFKKNSIIIDENVSTLEGWMRVLDDAAKKGLADYNAAIVRFVSENKELSAAVIQNINDQKLLDGQAVSTMDQVFLLAGTFENYTAVVKKASENVWVEKQSESINELTKQAELFSKAYKKIQTEMQRGLDMKSSSEFSSENMQTQIQEGIDALSQNLEVPKAKLEEIGTDIANHIFNMYKLKENGAKFAAEYIAQMKKATDLPEAFWTALEAQMTAKFTNLGQAAGKANLDALKEIFASIPKEIQDLEKTIPTVEIFDYEKQKKALQKTIEEMFVLTQESQLFKDSGKSVDELKKALIKLQTESLEKLIIGFGKVKKEALDMSKAFERLKKTVADQEELKALELKVRKIKELGSVKKAELYIEKKLEEARINSLNLGPEKTKLYKELIAFIKKRTKAEEELEKQIADDEALKDRALALTQEIVLLQDYLDNLEAGMPIKEADNALERKRAELSMINQGLDEDQIRKLLDLKKAIEDKKNATAEEIKELKKQQDAYDDFADTIQKDTADILRDWDNAWDSMIAIMKNALIEMAAAAISNRIVIPVAMLMGSAMGMSWQGASFQDMSQAQQAGMGMPSGSALTWVGENIPGMGALKSAMAWNMPGTATIGSELGWGAAAAQDIGMARAGTSLGTALGYGAIGSLGYQYLGGALGLPQGKYSGLGAGAGGALGGAYAGSAMSAMGGAAAGAKAGSVVPVVGTIIGAVLGGLAGSLFGGGSKKEPKVRVLSGQWGEGHGQPGELNSDFGYRTWIQDVEGSGNRSEIGNAMMHVFDAQFQAIEDATSWGLKEALAGTSFFMSTAKFKDYDNDLETAFTAMSDDVFRQINQSLVSAMGLSSVGLDTSFFEGLRADGETLLQTFARFATIAESIDDFSGRMDQQVADGKTAEQAFGNLVVIAETLQAVTSATDAIGTSSGINNVRNMIQAQADYMKALKDAVATQDELAQVQVGISQQIGASISGLTADSLQSVLASGGDITGVLQATVKNTAAQTIAGLASESIMAEYGNSLNQLIGDAFKNINAEDLQTSDLIDALNSIINDFDWDSMDAEVSAAADAINDFIAEIEQASKSVDELKNTYLDYLQKEIDIRQTAFDNAKNVLEEYIDGEERLIDARRQAAKSIDDFINGLMGSTQAPVQSLEFFEKRYVQLLSDAQTAGPDDIGNAVSALTSFTSQYLDFAGAYGGQNYNTLFNSVVSDLESVGADQLDQADVQTRELRDIKDLIGDTDGKLFDLNEAVQSFVDAKIGLDESAWMVQELNSLASIDSNLLLLYDAQRAYYGKVDTSKEPQTPIPEMDYVQQLYSTIGRSGFGSDMNQIDPAGYQYWIEASKTRPPEELSKAFYNAVHEYIAQNPDDPYTQFVSPYMGYADGGIISGPTSGYQLPGATFHGTEAIVPLKNGSIPVDIRSGNQDIRVVVKIGNRELKDITTEIIRTDPEAQGQIRRVANG